MTKIISYNVNGIRAAMKKGLIDWLTAAQPDILCIQETKAQPDQIPLFEFEMLGYRTYVHSAKKKGYSGVALLSKKEPDHVEVGMGIQKYEHPGEVTSWASPWTRIHELLDDLPSVAIGAVPQEFKLGTDGPVAGSYFPR